jgi:hypothetical protein
MIEHKFHGEPENPFTELSELRIKVESDKFGTKFSLRGSLKMDAMNYDHNGIDYIIGVSVATLALSLSGLRATEGTHYGEQRLDDALELKEHQVANKSGTTADIKLASTAAAAPEAMGSLALSSGTESVSQFNRKMNRAILAVKSLPSDRWKISVPRVIDQIEWISGSAFIDDLICEMDSTPVNTSRSVEANLMIRKMDIEVSARSGNKAMRTLRVFRNKEAILAQIAAKAIKRQSAVNNLAADEKVIVISRHALEQVI